MAKKEPQTGKDFVNLAHESDKVQNVHAGKGSHTVVEFEDGSSASVPVHGNKQLGKGIRHQILKAFKVAGMLHLLVLVAIAIWLVIL